MIYSHQFRPKTSSCQLPYQRPSSSADCTRELFKGSTDRAVFQIALQKIFFVGGCGFLWVTS